MILDLLRARTRPMHARLEATVAVFDQLQSVERYGALLARFLGFYAPLEDRLARVLAGTPTELSFAARRKVPWLEADLRYLGCDTATLDQLPRCREIPPAIHLSSALGCLYVLEGATLGGSVIRPHVERQLGLRPGRGCTFFSSYGDRVGDMWQRFCHFLCDFAAVTPGVNDEIVNAAADTFASFDRWVAGDPA